MRGFVPRQRLGVVIIAAVALSGGVAVASPEFPPGGNPNVTLDVSPTDGDNLPSSAQISVSGAGLSLGVVVSGDILECSVDPNTGTDECTPTPSDASPASPTVRSPRR